MTTQRWGWCACVGVIFCAGAADAQTTVYRLNAGSFYEKGCHGGCACPILFHQALSGTFRLTRLAPDPLYEHYAVSGVRWHCAAADVTGGGAYRIGGEVAQRQEMILDLNIGGI